ncbi:cornifelin-like [Myxocyprinus asiaticus]|uniref:cornifelin-like n=1 Tax=Myxocyprinus asiaticus TaxID=70543 RepID=UPI002222D3DC|nr:cornifelin-like [Myxocyprinus asiaticus]XP_051540836.1 cornifelin-like [Myxocyprinus asiaticus]
MATTVVVQQPHVKVKTQMSAWSTGLFDCCQDMNSCCYAYWCCPCFACSTTGEFGESTCLPLIDLLGPGLMAAFGMVVCVPPVTLGMRVAVRHRYDIGGSLFEDILVSCCCVWCSWCQMNREIKERKKPITVVTMQPVVQAVPITTTTEVLSVRQQSTEVMGMA